MTHRSSPDSVEAWIEKNFSGHGRAIRRLSDDPIPGEPYMSMADAKELTREAIATFSAPAQRLPDLSELDALASVAKILEPTEEKDVYWLLDLLSTAKTEDHRKADVRLFRRQIAHVAMSEMYAALSSTDGGAGS